MLAVFKRPMPRRTATWLPMMLIMLLAVLPLAAQTVGASRLPAGANHSSANAIPFDQVGREADKQATGSDSGIAATADGAELRAKFQDLAGSLSAEGLWLRSTAEETKAAPFRVLATTLGRRLGVAQPLAGSGVVEVQNQIARFIRPHLIEEYAVSTDGVRQDFVLLDRPAGAGALRLEIAVAGAQAAASGD